MDCSRSSRSDDGRSILTRRGLWLATVFGLALFACSNDFDQFDADGVKDASASGGTDSGTGGSTGGAPNGGGTGGIAIGGGSGGTGGTGAVGGTGGAVGGAGGVAGGGGTAGSSCGAAMKLCGVDCVPDDQPATGCAAASCDPCVVQNGTANCAAGACGVASCNPGFGDCAGGAGNGCETNLTAPSNTSCGSCANNCTLQGYVTHFTCGPDLLCHCTSLDQCRSGNSGTAACAPGGICSCNGTLCNVGERCNKAGPNQVCSCNGQAACLAGQVCCQTPNACVDIATDEQNCGACGKVCPAATSCVSGTCQ